jgi:hypothetical protein
MIQYGICPRFSSLCGGTAYFTGTIETAMINNITFSEAVRKDGG